MAIFRLGFISIIRQSEQIDWEFIVYTSSLSAQGKLCPFFCFVIKIRINILDVINMQNIADTHFQLSACFSCEWKPTHKYLNLSHLVIYLSIRAASETLLIFHTYFCFSEHKKGGSPPSNLIKRWAYKYVSIYYTILFYIYIIIYYI